MSERLRRISRILLLSAVAGALSVPAGAQIVDRAWEHSEEFAATVRLDGAVRAAETSVAIGVAPAAAGFSARTDRAEARSSARVSWTRANRARIFGVRYGLPVAAMVLAAGLLLTRVVRSAEVAAG